MNKNELIEEVFNEIFVLERLKNKNLDLRFKILNTFLDASCKATYRKRKFNLSYSSFVSNYMFHAWFKMLSYEASEEEWLEVLECVRECPETPSGAYERLSKYLYSHVGWELIHEFDSKESVRVRTKTDRAMVKFNPINFSELVSEGDEISIDLIMKKEPNTEFVQSFVQDWYHAVRDDVLTDSQIEFLDALEEANHLLLEDDTNTEIEAIIRTNRANIDDKLQRIAKRLIGRFKADFPELEIDFNYKPTLRTKLIDLPDGTKYATIVDGLGNPVPYEKEEQFVGEVKSYKII